MACELYAHSGDYGDLYDTPNAAASGTWYGPIVAHELGRLGQLANCTTKQLIIADATLIDVATIDAATNYERSPSCYTVGLNSGG